MNAIKTEPLMAWPKFRFHLSTAILLMFAAGGLIGLNLYERFAEFEHIGVVCPSCVRMDCIEKNELRFGFPLRAGRRQIFLVAENPSALLIFAGNRAGCIFIKGKGLFGCLEEMDFVLVGILIDALFSIVVLFLVGIISEAFIRLKKHRALLSSPGDTAPNTQDSALPL